MKILFLDDDPERCRQFLQREQHGPDVVLLVTTAADCILALAARPFEECHLDHDLAGETYCDPARDDCGMAVVRWICLNKPDVRTFVVHTHNELAGPIMVAALEAAGYRVVCAPFQYKRFSPLWITQDPKPEGTKP